VRADIFRAIGGVSVDASRLVAAHPERYELAAPVDQRYRTLAPADGPAF
jgi:hypothetical protein